jgi:hypothetical protein
VFAAARPDHGRGQDAPRRAQRDFAAHSSKLGQLDKVLSDFDVLSHRVLSARVGAFAPLASEFRKTRRAALFDPAEESLVRAVEFLQRDEQRVGIRLREPFVALLFFELREVAPALVRAEQPAFFFVGFDAPGEIAVVDETSAAEILLDQDFLRRVRIDAKVVPFFHSVRPFSQSV